jgi:hypothetical protein
VLDVLLRLLALGRGFWHCEDDYFRQCSQRFELLVVGAAALGFACSADWAALGPGRWAQLRSRPGAVFACALPCLRAFVAVPASRRLLFGVTANFSSYASTLYLMVLALYCYASAGCLLFAGVFEYADGYRDRLYFFDNMLDCLLLLFRVGFGELFVPIMNSAIKVKGPVFGAGFFISWILVFCILIITMLTGEIMKSHRAIAGRLRRMESLRRQAALNGHGPDEGAELTVPVKVINEALLDDFETTHTDNLLIELPENHDGAVVVHLFNTSEALARAHEERRRSSAAGLAQALAVAGTGGEGGGERSLARETPARSAV